MRRRAGMAAFSNGAFYTFGVAAHSAGSSGRAGRPPAASTARCAYIICTASLPARPAARRTALDRMRYRPQQWSTRGSWVVYEQSRGEPWYGFDAVRDLDGVPPDILMVPLLGHTLGHAGVAVRVSDGWLFYAADAYFY